MGLFTRREPETVDKAAAKAYKRGDQILVRVVYMTFDPARQRLARRIALIEAAGWKLEDQQDSEKVVRGVHETSTRLTFRAVSSVA
jgi:hypothetical protein